MRVPFLWSICHKNMLCQVCLNWLYFTGDFNKLTLGESHCLIYILKKLLLSIWWMAKHTHLIGLLLASTIDLVLLLETLQKFLQRFICPHIFKWCAQIHRQKTPWYVERPIHCNTPWLKWILLTLSPAQVTCSFVENGAI